MVDHDDHSYSLAATIYLIRLPLSRKHKLFQAEEFQNYWIFQYLHPCLSLNEINSQETILSFETHFHLLDYFPFFYMHVSINKIWRIYLAITFLADILKHQFFFWWMARIINAITSKKATVESLAFITKDIRN